MYIAGEPSGPLMFFPFSVLFFKRDISMRDVDIIQDVEDFILFPVVLLSSIC